MDDTLNTTADEMDPIRLRRRREHLVAEITRAGRTKGSRRVALILVTAIALATGAGTAMALGGFDWLAQQDQLEANSLNPFRPRVIGDRYVLASGPDWAVLAWRSDKGICIGLSTPDLGSRGCGFPVQDAGTEPPVSADRTTVAGVAGSATGGYMLAAGVAAPSVARVVVELADGRNIPTSLYPAPAGLDANVQFFVGRFRSGSIRFEAGKAFLKRFVAYDRSGRFVGDSIVAD
jgi:hypothetical protein